MTLMMQRIFHEKLKFADFNFFGSKSPHLYDKSQYIAKIEKDHFIETFISVI